MTTGNTPPAVDTLDDEDVVRLVAALRNIRDNAQATLRGPLKTWAAFELETAVRIADAALAPCEAVQS